MKKMILALALTMVVSQNAKAVDIIWTLLGNTSNSTDCRNVASQYGYPYYQFNVIGFDLNGPIGNCWGGQ